MDSKANSPREMRSDLSTHILNFLFVSVLLLIYARIILAFDFALNDFRDYKENLFIRDICLRSTQIGCAGLDGNRLNDSTRGPPLGRR